MDGAKKPFKKMKINDTEIISALKNGGLACKKENLDIEGVVLIDDKFMLICLGFKKFHPPIEWKPTVDDLISEDWVPILAT